MKPTTKKEWTKLSKLLSLVLRHRPALIGIELEEAGWTATDVLLQKMKAHGEFINMEILEELVQNNNKQRFAFNEDKSKIRANQGHSVKVDLNLAPSVAPEILYHGTAKRFVNSIKQGGIQKAKRHQVHLSANIETAKQVGARHGKVVVLIVEAKRMEQEGYLFYLSENGVWLTDFVPVEFIRFEEE